MAEAERLIATFSAAMSDVKKGDFKPDTADKPAKVERQHLVVKANIDTLDYSEQRADLLQSFRRRRADSTHNAEIGRSAKRASVSWIELAAASCRSGLSPVHCRGCVLGDDMGLGKTIQLLSLIASCREHDPTIDPVLIVAPVALLENWKEEIDKFFVPNSMPVLTLYGETLAGKRLPKQQLDHELAQQGITRLLKRDWLGDAKVVLTTYETLRDLEFALAAQKWSIMICDEAQKIKNPNAMVTRAAKKQNVRFRKNACTGTPVENTLADLWCLFD